MKLVTSCLLSLLVVSLAGCHITITGFDGIAGSGVSEQEDRDVADFEEISFDGAATVNVRLGDEYAFSITADDNLLELIETKVVDGELRIKPTESINPETDIVIDITMPVLKAVEVDGAADFNLKEMDGESFALEVRGAVNFTANGKLKKLDIDCKGASEMDLRDLECESVKIDVSGASSGSVFASKSIDAVVSGAGTLTVYGNPEDVNRSVNGVGEIKIAE